MPSAVTFSLVKPTIYTLLSSAAAYHVHITRYIHVAERRGRVVNTPASYLGDPGWNLGLVIGYPE
jgi:hypothetical protein